MQQKPVDKIAILEAVAQAWNREGINYAVAHGIEGYPEGVGRDLDVIMYKKQLKRAMRIAAEYLRDNGFAVVTPPNPWNAKWLFAFRNEISLEIDFLPSLFWGPGLFVNEPTPILQIGSFKVDPWAGFAKRVLIGILGSKPKEPWITSLEEPIVRRCCYHLFGKKLTDTLLDILEAHDEERLEQLTPILRRTVVLRSVLLQPWKCIKLIISWVLRQVGPYVTSCAPIVALVGPDGVGKSGTIEHFLRIAPKVFVDTVVKHWRPGLLPRFGALIGKLDVAPGEDGLIRPRRKSGHLHFLRLAYYGVDFILGHFIKDRYICSTLRVVLYDRCALDMAVDPLRYGLSSGKSTRLLWRLIPKPDLVILLYDTPERIHSRKPELEEQEIDHQLEEWLRLVKEGKVDTLIPVNAPSDEIAQRVKGLIIEAFIGKHDKPFILKRKEQDISWLAFALANKNVEVQSVTLKKDTTQRGNPNDLETLAEFGLITLKDGRGYLIPSISRPAAISALDLFNAQTLKARSFKKILSIGLYLGIIQLLLPKVRFIKHQQKQEVDCKDNIFILDHLKNIFGRNDLRVAIATGTPGPQRKPVLLVMSSKGESLGYVKVGWNEQTRHLIKNEKRALEVFNSYPFEYGVLPRAIYFANLDDKSLLITEPLSLGDKHRSRAKLEDLHVQFLMEVSRVSVIKEKFIKSRFFSRLSSRLNDIKAYIPSYQMQVLEEALDLLVLRLGSVELPWFWCLGDFVPWNIGIDRDVHKIIAIDVEYAAGGSVPGWDIFHFLSQSFHRINEQLRAIYSVNYRAMLSYFRALDIDPSVIPLLHIAYLLDLWTLWAQMWKMSNKFKSVEASKILREKVTLLAILIEMLKTKGEISL